MRPHTPALVALLSLVLSTSCLGADNPSAKGPFAVQPYVQIGDVPVLADRESLVVLWHADDTDSQWAVEYRPTDASEADDWSRAEVTAARRVAVPTIDPHRVYRAELTGLEPGDRIAYRVLHEGKVAFEATARARRPAGQATRVVVFGDIASGSSGQRAIAARVARSRPDYVVVTGDVVYSRGRISEYRSKFFPVYNADETGSKVGAPLLRSVPFLPVVGNHDIVRDLDDYPDGMAYFLYWDLPRNGPPRAFGARGTPTLEGPRENLDAFRAAAGDAYPSAVNYSFDYGDAHWTLIDVNTYVDLDDPALRDWIARDLEAAAGARWRFVALHQPGFSASKAHGSDQRTRVLAPLFEAGKVDIVFAGHVHNYQRTHPLQFEPAPRSEDDPRGRVRGTWTLDTRFDGREHTQPDGVLYLVTGAGGAGLYDPDQQDDQSTWQPFTAKFISQVHSFTRLDVDGPKLTVRQLAADGSELDRFVVTKPAR